MCWGGGLLYLHNTKMAETKQRAFLDSAPTYAVGALVAFLGYKGAQAAKSTPR